MTIDNRNPVATFSAEHTAVQKAVAADQKKAALLSAAHAGRVLDVASAMRTRGEEVSDFEIANAMQESGDIFGAARFRSANPMAHFAPVAPAPEAARNEHHAEYLRLKATDPFAAARYGDEHAAEVYGKENE